MVPIPSRFSELMEGSLGRLGMATAPRERQSLALRRGGPRANHPSVHEYRLAVEEHGAGAALGHAAAELHPGVPEEIAQHPEQGHVGGGVDLVCLAVDVELHVTSGDGAATLSEAEAARHPWSRQGQPGRVPSSVQGLEPPVTPYGVGRPSQSVTSPQAKAS